jgi:hypothetical protein
MADEIKVTVGAQVANGLLSHLVPAKTTKFTQTTARAGAVTQDIGTTEETVSFGDGVPGYIVATNLDATNYVTLRFASGANAIRLLPNGGQAVFYLAPSTTLYAIANTAGCKVKFDWFNS